MRHAIVCALLIPAVFFGPFAPTLAGDRPQRDLLQVKFKLINEKGYPIVVVTNMTGRDIDNVRGGIVVEGPGGEVMAATGHTDAVTGDVFVAAGKSVEFSPFGFNRKPELMAKLRSEPETLRFFFEVRDVTYMDAAGK